MSSKDLYQVPASVIASEVALLAQIVCGYVSGCTATVKRTGDDVAVSSLDRHKPLAHIISASEWQKALRVCAAGAVGPSTFVEGQDYVMHSGSFGSVKSAVRQGTAANADCPLYALRPNGSTATIPVEDRDAAINALGTLWSRRFPLQDCLGITLDPDGQIGADTWELCHFPR